MSDTSTTPSDDLLLPFHITGGAMRGRAVRLGPLLNRILAAHEPPRPVGLMLGEALALAAALAGGLKYEGVFTLQIQSDGPISLLVGDVTSHGAVRGYARFDAEAVARAAPDDRLPAAPVPALLGRGHLAFTVDQGPDTDRYQGIVALDGATLAECARHYFGSSEQIPTTIRLAAGTSGDGGWHAGAVILQRMPVGPNSPILTSEEADEAWNRGAILLESVRDDELLDPGLAPRRLLHRLFHAEGLVPHPARELFPRCRCSPQRVAATLRSFPRQEIEALKDEAGNVVVTCEFCKTSYVFGDGRLDALFNG